MLKVLNLRNVPEELMRELKAEAALSDEQFHPFCVALLVDALARRLRARQPSITVYPPIEVNIPAPPTAEPPQEIEIT